MGRNYIVVSFWEKKTEVFFTLNIQNIILYYIYK